MRLLFVTPRWGEVAGGAERAMRGFATRCCDGYDVEVATTCAVDHHTWRNELPAGVERDGDVTSPVRGHAARRRHARPRRVELPRPGAGAGGVGVVGADAAVPARGGRALRRDPAGALPVRHHVLVGRRAAVTGAARAVPARRARGAHGADARAARPCPRLHLPLPRRGGASARRLAPVRASRVVGVGVDVAPPLDRRPRGRDPRLARARAPVRRSRWAGSRRASASTPSSS